MNLLNDPLVSVVIPTYNRAEYLFESVLSVLDQDYRPLELIIVNDGSTDNTDSIIRAIEMLIRIEDVESQIINNPENIGCGGSLEIGFQRSKGEFISYLGSDDLFIRPDKTRKQVEAMIKSEGIWSYYRNYYYGREILDARLHKPSYIPYLHFLNPIFERDSTLRFLILQWKNPINSSSLMIDGEFYREHGGWKEWTKNASCDGLLLMLYSLYQSKCVVLNDAPVFYRTHPGQVSKDRDLARNGSKRIRQYILNYLEEHDASRAFISLTKILGRFH